MERIRHFTFAVLAASALATLAMLICGVHPWDGRWALLENGVLWFFIVLTLSPYCVLALIARLGSRNLARSVVVLVSSVLVAVLGIGSIVHALFVHSSRVLGFDIFFGVVSEWIVCGITAVVVAFIPTRMATSSSFAYGRWTARVIECTLAIWIILFMVTFVVASGLAVWVVVPLGWIPGWLVGIVWESHARKKTLGKSV